MKTLGFSRFQGESYTMTIDRICLGKQFLTQNIYYFIDVPVSFCNWKCFLIANGLKLCKVSISYCMYAVWMSSFSNAREEVKLLRAVLCKLGQSMPSFFNWMLFAYSAYFRSNKVWKVKNVWYANKEILHPECLQKRMR